MDSITSQEAIAAFKEQIGPLEQLVFNTNINQPMSSEDKKDLREVILYRYNFTNETIDIIKELQLKYPNDNELKTFYNRYTDCSRQLLKLYNKLNMNTNIEGKYVLRDYYGKILNYFIFKIDGTYRYVGPNGSVNARYEITENTITYINNSRQWSNGIEISKESITLIVNGNRVLYKREI